MKKHRKKDNHQKETSFKRHLFLISAIPQSAEGACGAAPIGAPGDVLFLLAPERGRLVNDRNVHIYTYIYIYTYVCRIFIYIYINKSIRMYVDYIYICTCRIMLDIDEDVKM